MTTYRLPDQLGGGIAEGVANFGTLGRRLVKVPGINGDVELPSNCLTVVLLPEPPPGSVVLDKDRDAWQRECGNDRPWAAAVFTEGVGELSRCDWAELNDKYGPLRLLVPDPADDAPALPCTIPTKWATRQVRVESARDGYIGLFTTDEPTDGRTARLDAMGARMTAAALLRAAREVEQP